MLSNDTYYTIAAPSQGLFKDNGSRFISLSYPVSTAQEVSDIVSSLKKQYHDARHHCYAYRLGLRGERYRANDDGEPSGSAGRQILGQIDSAGLSDVLVVVVRYFGGIKLGIPGLIRAYKTSAADAISHSSKVLKIAKSRFRLNFAYDKMPTVMEMVKEMGLGQLSRDFGVDCSIEVEVRLDSVPDFFARIKKMNIFIEELFI